MVVGLGDVEIALAVELAVERLVERRVGRLAAVAAVALVARAGQGGQDAGIIVGAVEDLGSKNQLKSKNNKGKVGASWETLSKSSS